MYITSTFSDGALSQIDPHSGVMIYRHLAHYQYYYDSRDSRSWE